MGQVVDPITGRIDFPAFGKQWGRKQIVVVWWNWEERDFKKHEIMGIEYK